MVAAGLSLFVSSLSLLSSLPSLSVLPLSPSPSLWYYERCEFSVALPLSLVAFPPDPSHGKWSVRLFAQRTERQKEQEMEDKGDRWRDEREEVRERDGDGREEERERDRWRSIKRWNRVREREREREREYACVRVLLCKELQCLLSSFG